MRDVHITFNSLLCTSFLLWATKRLFCSLFELPIKLIFDRYGLRFSFFTNLVCDRHTKAAFDFAARILLDHHHHLHEELSNARSHTSTMSRVKLLLSTTAAYRKQLSPSSTITTSGWPKRRTDVIHTGTVYPLPPFIIVPFFRFDIVKFVKD